MEFFDVFGLGGDTESLVVVGRRGHSIVLCELASGAIEGGDGVLAMIG